MAEKNIYTKDTTKDFFYSIYRENLWKFIIFGTIFALVELGLAISITSLWVESVTRLRIYIVIFSFIDIPIMILIYVKYDKLYRFAPPIIHLTVLIILFWGTEISIYSQFTTANVMIYILVMLVFANIAIIKLRTKFILFLIPQLWFMINVSMANIDKAVLVSNDVNSSIIFIISISLSAYIFKLSFQNHKYITTIESQNMKLTELTLVDSMTGIYNHNSIYNFLDKEIEYSKRYGTPLSIIMYDIDFFKNINDTFGHVYGDEILLRISEELKNNSRTTDYIGRYGGEEFLVILPNTTLTDASNKANVFRKIIEESIFKQDIKLTISGGVTQWVDQTAEQLVEYADQLMYLAKANGRNKVESNANPIK